MQAARRTVIALLLASAFAWPAQSAVAASTVRHARFDLAHSRAAGLKLGKSTKARAVRRLGRPRRSVRDRNTGTRRLIWGCGSGCTFEVRVRRRRVVTVWAYGEVVRRRIRTAAGSYLGISERKAERREHGTFADSCTREFTKSNGRVSQSLSASGGRVDSILMFTRKGGVPC